MTNLIQDKSALEERLNKHESRLYNLENLNIPQKVSKAVDEIVTDAVDWTLQSPLHLVEARKKRQKRLDSPRTPSKSPPLQPPLAGASGASGFLNNPIQSMKRHVSLMEIVLGFQTWLAGSHDENKSMYCIQIMPPKMRTQSDVWPTAESLGGGTGVRVDRGGRGRRPREGNDEHADDLNGQGNDQGMGANEGVEGVNGNVEGANRGALDFPTIIAQQLQNLLPAMLAQVGNQGNVGNQNGNVVNEKV
nr:hypothetical protein [Tanacetum cinerariifolium]